jgi:energy-coupling factor transporter ATP-binding protein EcfA2
MAGELVILLIGATGSGKTSFVKLATGCDVNISRTSQIAVEHPQFANKIQTQRDVVTTKRNGGTRTFELSIRQD